MQSSRYIDHRAHGTKISALFLAWAAACSSPSAPNDVPLPEGACRGDLDCAANAPTCLAPGEASACGTCRDAQNPCEDSAECDPVGTGQACLPLSCACSPARECAPGCSTTGCAEGQTCNPDTELCDAMACTGEGMCPPQFGCDDMQCKRRGCDGDGECDGGYCVEGRCHDDLGTCQALAV